MAIADSTTLNEMDTIRTCIVEPRDTLAVKAQASLDDIEFPIPLTSRLCWFENLGSDQDRLAISTSANGSFLAALGVAVKKTRAMPGHSTFEICAIGDAYATPTGTALIREITRYAASIGRVLRVRAELQCRAEEARDTLRRSLALLGYRQVPTEKIPARTIAIDLTRTEDEIFGSFSSSTRHKIRKAARQGLEVDTIVDPGLGGRMNSILAETFDRTGGFHEELDWEQVLAVCRNQPHHSRLVGAFNGSGRRPEDLLAFAWATRLGDRVLYDVSASTRKTDIRLPLLYSVIWDQIAWAKRNRVSWFDMNGVTGGSPEAEDALARISNFKKGFGGTELEFGEEWVFEPSWFKAALALFAGTAARNARRLWRPHG